MPVRKIDKPTSYPEAYAQYGKCVPDDGNLFILLEEIMKETEQLARSLSEEKLLYRYAPGKWSIKDVLVHLIDCERIITYRAERIARGDKTPLPGFDEESYAAEAHADARSIDNILEEMKALRASSILFIASLEESVLDRSGTANNNPLSVRLLVNHVYGHHKHHLNIIYERYLA